MNKTAIKNFAVWARKKLIADITYKAGLMGISEKEIKSALPQSTQNVQFFDIGTKEPYSISGIEIKQREKLTEEIIYKAKQSDYATAYKAVVEEVAYTWFNRLVAVRFMEVNDYLPSRIRVLSSESGTKDEPDQVTTPFDADFDFTPYEKDRIVQLTHETMLDELFRMLFIKQCNALNTILPNLFEKTSDFTELLLNVSISDKDGVVYHLVHDISEDDFNVSKEGQVEIIGWMYQYYNTEPKDEVFALLKNNVKITKERIPAATQIFTPDWIVRYMVENSLGRLWLEGHPNDSLKSGWKYYLDEAEQEDEVQKQLDAIREKYKTIKPEDIKIIDPCMGSGHILVYAFEVLMQIYESAGYNQRDAAKSIIEHNIYGLDIDNRAFQLSYFAMLMKARQYNRRILNDTPDCHLYSIQESNGINRRQLQYFGVGMNELERNTAIPQLESLLDTFIDAKEYGSILSVDNYDWNLLYKFVGNVYLDGQMAFEAIGIEDTMVQLRTLVGIGAVMSRKYDVVVTNPPYMGNGGFSTKLTDYSKEYYTHSKNDLYSIMIERANQMCTSCGFVSMITMQSWINAPTFLDFRKYLFSSTRISIMNNMGSRAFDEIQGEKVKNTAFILNMQKINNWKPLFIDLTNISGENNKKEAFLLHKNLYSFPTQDDFLQHELCLVVYKTKNVNEIYHPRTLVGDLCQVKRCIATGNDAAFIRSWFEVDFNFVCSLEKHEESRWFFVACGGNSRRWYGNIIHIINWEDNGRDIKAFSATTGKATLRNLSFMFKEGLTYTYTSMGSGLFNARTLYPTMASIGVGPVMVDCQEPFYLLGFTNSVVFRWLIDIMYGKVSTFETGNISKISCIFRPSNNINKLVNKCISASKRDWDSFEISHEFISHPFLNNKPRTEYSDESNIHRVNNIANSYNIWNHITEMLFRQLKSDEEELNRIFIDIYGLEDELFPDIEKKSVSIRMANLGRDIRSFVSYAVGCMFGRYSLDVEGLVFAGGEWDESKYTTFIPNKYNILPITIEEYFEDDIVRLFVTFVKKAFDEETLEQNLDFIAKALGNNGNSSREIIRNYFLADFFVDHCKIYQKRPIYWLFDSGKTDGFKALVYLHRYNENTIGNMRIDYLHRIQRIYDSEITRMEETINNSSNAREFTAAEKRRDKLTMQLKETKKYDEKIAHLALTRMSIDLDDGVVFNYEKIQTGNDGNKLEVLARL